ncbi:MAG: xanthine dehydrogenase family protein molybdopterin-binding subunit [Thermomicrobiales bacterium]|nr:xanthine dehydrogenase family protein molybdopterin-binding subunit [Thermomicrobiales bacterium]
MPVHTTVGQRLKRTDAPQKLTGVERFTGDLRFPGQLFARPVGSPYAHARIKNVNASAAMDVPGVVAVLTFADLPIARPAGGGPVKSPLADGEILYAGQFAAIVLAESDAAATDGAAAVVVDYDELPVIVTLDDGLDPDSAPVRASGGATDNSEASMHNADAATTSAIEQETLPPNVSGSLHFERGDVAQGLEEADEIVELTINSLTVHQGYLETQACLVNISPMGKLEVYTSTQAAFHCRNRVAETLGLPHHQIDVHPMPVGGGFGGKFVLIEPLVSALAVATKRPVLFQYTRMEDFLSGNPAPDCRITIKVGAKRDGTLTALQANVVFDTGAFAGSPMQIGSILMGGYYRVPNLDIQGYEVLTHKTAAGAYRAPGAQQGTFAIESAMDELARRLGIDPLELRLKNCVVEGDPRPNGSPWPRIGLKETLEGLQRHPRWQNREQAREAGRGVGIAIGGWPGGIEPATAICRLDHDGTLTVVLGSVDLNGTNTTFAQIAAEEFGMAASDVQITTASTDGAPFAGGTGGSKITYTVGPAVQKAAADAKAQILSIASQQLEAAVEDLEIAEGAVRVKGVPTSSITLKEIARMSMSVAAKYEPVYGRGATATTLAAPGFAAHLVEVEVDELTGETRVVNYVAAQDVGFAINPALVEGQIHGGIMQGIGWALYEGLAFDAEGQLLTASLMDYALPKADMAPHIEVVLVGVPSEMGAYGSKGVGEPPAIPGPAAIANAIRDAAGVRVTNLPMRPQEVVAAMDGVL